MNVQVNINTIALMVFFVTMFVAISWVMPALVATYVPDSHVADVEQFEVQNATVGDETVRVCYTRYIGHPQTADIHGEVVRIDGEGRDEVLRWDREEYFQGGTTTVETRFPINPEAEPGKYRYIVTAEFDLANGRVSREITAVSEPFYIKENSDAGDRFICE